MTQFKTEKNLKDAKLDTKAVWAGEAEDRAEGTTTQTPIVQSVSFGYHDLDEWQDVALAKKAGHIYSRNTNPTLAVFEEKMRMLEGAEAATSFASGMAAISNSLFALLHSGDRVVTIKDTYGGTNQLFREFLPRIGVEVCLSDTKTEDVEREVLRGCQLVYLETPTNPTLKVIDIARLSKAARTAGAIVITDNTFATPVNQRPLALGSDLVLHSASKFLGGHADALGGVLCGRTDLVKQVFHYREITGAALDPFAAYLLLRGLKTLHLRIERQNAGAMEIARFLETHPAVARVFYPGLDSHSEHATAARQMSGFGGVLSFALHGGYEAVKNFLPRLMFAHRAANLGAVETVVGPPATTSHVEVSARDREAMGIPEALVRYSTGIEDVSDLIADLEQALDSLDTESAATTGSGRAIG